MLNADGKCLSRRSLVVRQSHHLLPFLRLVHFKITIQSSTTGKLTPYISCHSLSSSGHLDSLVR